MKKKYIIIDTNVPVKAANTSPSNVLDKQCSLACLSFVEKLLKSDDIVVLDSNKEILRAYQNNCRASGQDNVATIFLNWILRNLSLRNGGRVEICSITKTTDGTYEEYPVAPELAGFDPSDKKFIALAKAHPKRPSIVEGSDSLWWGYKDIFKQFGIHIKFLCEDYVRSIYEDTRHA